MNDGIPLLADSCGIITVTGLNTVVSTVTLTDMVWAGTANTHGGIAGGMPGHGVTTDTNPSLVIATGSPSIVVVDDPMDLNTPPCIHCNVPAELANRVGNIADIIRVHCLLW